MALLPRRRFRKFCRESGFTKQTTGASGKPLRTVATSLVDLEFTKLVKHHSATAAALAKRRRASAAEAGHYLNAQDGSSHENQLTFVGFRDLIIAVAQKIPRPSSSKLPPTKRVMRLYLGPLLQREGRRAAARRTTMRERTGNVMGDIVDGEVAALSDAGTLALLNVNRHSLRALFECYADMHGTSSRRRSTVRSLASTDITRRQRHIDATTMAFPELLAFCKDFCVVPQFLDSTSACDALCHVCMYL